MALSELKMFELAEENYTSCMYKGFDIAVSRDRYELSARIRLMLEENSDLYIHIDTVMASNLTELKEEIQHTINNVLCLTGSKMTKMYQNGEITIVDYNTGKYYFTKDTDKINAYREYEKQEQEKKQDSKLEESNASNDDSDNSVSMSLMNVPTPDQDNINFEVTFDITKHIDDFIKCINCLNAIQISYDLEIIDKGTYSYTRDILFTNATQKQYEIIIEMLKMNNISYYCISQ